MTPYNILVPLDFSDISRISLHSAARLAELLGGSVTPFHSYLPVSELNGPYTFGMVSTPAEDYDQMEQVISKRLKEVSEEEVDAALLNEPLVAVGNPARAIATASGQFDAIVMSTHGRTGFSRFFLGSISEKVLRISNIPVLIVNKNREFDSLSRIMVTTDFSDNSLKAFPRAAELARRSGAELELLHIFIYDEHEEGPDEGSLALRKQRLDELAERELTGLDRPVVTRIIPSPDTAHEAIIKYNADTPHDLIVISSVGRTGIEYLMLGSTTANVVRHVNSPVFSINPRPRSGGADTEQE